MSVRPPSLFCVLAAGTLVFVSSARAQGTVEPSPRAATIVSAGEGVEVQATEDAALSPAQAGQDVEPGGRVQGGGKDGTELILFDGSSVQLDAGGIMTLGAAATSWPEVSLASGRARFEVKSGRLQIQTPSASVRLESGSAVVAVDAEGNTVISVFTAKAIARGLRGGPVIVGAGFGTSLSKSAAPTAPKPLPEAPQWSSEVDKDAGVLVAVWKGSEGRVALGWDPVEKAQGYLLQLRGTESSRVLRVYAAPASDPSLRSEALRSGLYHASVSAIAEGGFESIPSPATSIRVTEVDAVGLRVEGAYALAPPGSTLRAQQGVACEPRSFTDSGRYEITCAVGQQRSAPLSLLVASIAVHTEPLRRVLPRGAEARVRLRYSRTMPAEAQLVSSAQVDVLEYESVSPTEAELRIRIGKNAAAEEQLRWLMYGEEDRVVGSVAIHTDASRLPKSNVAPKEQRSSNRQFARGGEAFTAAPTPLLLGLSSEVRGVTARLGLARIGDFASQQALWRVAAETEAGFFEERLRVRLGTVVDPWERGEIDEGLGGSDLRLGVATAVLSELLPEALSLRADVSCWLPTGDEPNSMDVVRLEPSIGLTFEHRYLTFRTRQGLLWDLAQSAARGREAAWASAYGADMSFRTTLPELIWGFGAELQSAVGNDDSFFLRLAAGGQLWLAYLPAKDAQPPLHVSVGLRRSLSDDLREQIGDWMMAASIRITHSSQLFQVSQN